MAPYWIRHYTPWVDRLIVYVDAATNDGSLELLQANPKVEARAWNHSTGLDDEQFIQTANHWPNKEGRENHLDWVGFVDADELLWAPDYKKLLRTDKTDAIRSRGYALISRTGWPVDDGRQLYEQVVTGVEQTNHSKFLIWRPGFDISHNHGRHDFPAYGGRTNGEFMMKNYHCHHLAPEETVQRNQRNYDRAHEKRFAWNYEKGNESKGIGGTALWASNAMNNLIDVTKADINA